MWWTDIHLQIALLLPDWSSTCVYQIFKMTTSMWRSDTPLSNVPLVIILMSRSRYILVSFSHVSNLTVCTATFYTYAQNLFSVIKNTHQEDATYRNLSTFHDISRPFDPFKPIQSALTCFCIKLGANNCQCYVHILLSNIQIVFDLSFILSTSSRASAQLATFLVYL